jgi:hypothetical protein
MQLRAVVLLVFTLFFSCKQDEAYHLSAEKMQEVLFDVHMAEAYSMELPKDSTYRRNERLMDSLAVHYKKIFRHHNITPQQYKESLNWYQHNPEELDSIYVKLIPQIMKLDKSFE